MTISLGKHKVLKEFKIEIDKDGNVSGFMNLISRYKIKLTGKIQYFNDIELYEYAPPPSGERFSKSLTNVRTKKSFKIIPIKLHFIQNKVLNENEYIDFGTTQKITAKEYVKRFKGDTQKITGRIAINKDLDVLRIETASTPYGDDWRAGAYLVDIEVLEAKNVPGLKDVKK
ncbi:MAG: hypothetical protein ABIH20_06625 [Candidatus Diapherotrites archaeon]